MDHPTAPLRYAVIQPFAPRRAGRARLCAAQLVFVPLRLSRQGEQGWGRKKGMPADQAHPRRGLWDGCCLGQCGGVACALVCLEVPPPLSAKDERDEALPWAVAVSRITWQGRTGADETGGEPRC